jgi:hypothetical protein
MRARLEQARFYWLGAMPQEYRLNLKLARQLVPEIEDRSLWDRIAAFSMNSGKHRSGEPGAAPRRNAS